MACHYVNIYFQFCQCLSINVSYVQLISFGVFVVFTASGKIEEPQEETALQMNHINVASPEVSEEDRSALADMEKTINLAIKGKFCLKIFSY